MNGEDLLNAIKDIDEKYYAEAEYGTFHKKFWETKPFMWCAAIGIVLLTVVLFLLIAG